MHGVFDLHARGSLFIIGAKLLEPVLALDPKCRAWGRGV